MDIESDLVNELAKRLNLTRPLIFLDLETTGLSIETDRIWELGALKLKPTGEATAFCRRFNPGIPVCPDAKAKTGITDEELAGEAPFRQFAAALFESLKGCDLATFNGRRFDARILQNEFKRQGYTWGPGTPGWDGAIVDAWSIWLRQEPRDMKGALKRFAPAMIEEAGTHGAIDDVLGLVAVMAGQLDAFWPQAPGAAIRRFAVQELEDAGRDPNWIDAEGKIAWANGVPVFTFGDQNGVPVTKAPAGFVEWLLKKDFPADTKALVVKIRSGKLPEQKD